MSYRRFLPYDVLGAGLWASAFCVLGYVFWQSFDRVSEYASTRAFALGTVIVVVAGTVTVVRRLSDAEQRRALRTWLEGQAARPALRPLAKVLGPFLARALLPAARHAARPARFLADRLRPTDLGLALTTLVAIWVVGGFAFGSLLHEVDGRRYAAGDLEALSLVADLRLDAVADLARVVSGLGAFGVTATVLGLAAAVLAVRGHAVEAAALVVALVLTRAGVDLTADALARPEPGAADALARSGSEAADVLARPARRAEGSSFPSAHAAYAVAYVAVAVTLARGVTMPAGRAVVVVGAAVLAVVVGLADVYLRRGFLSDVAAGWGLAAALFAACGVAGVIVGHLRDNRTHA